MFTPEEKKFIENEINRLDQSDLAPTKYNCCPLCNAQFYMKRNNDLFDTECDHVGSNFHLITSYYLKCKIAALTRRVDELEGALQYERTQSLNQALDFIDTYMAQYQITYELNHLIQQYRNRKVDNH